jgi:hypothetical protein
MANAPEAQYVVEILADLNNIKSQLAKLNGTAGQAGKEAGNSFGGQFQQAFNAILATLSFQQVIGQITSWVNASNELKASGIALNNVINSQNYVADKNNEKLKSGNLTLLEKAKLLGYSEDKLYKTVSATKAHSNELKIEQDAIKQATNAFEKENRAREDTLKTQEKQLKALQKENQEKLKLARQALGADQAETRAEQLQDQINTLEVQKKQAIVNGQMTGNLDAQISKLQDQKDLEDAKLRVIDDQTRSIRIQGQTAEDVMKNQIASLQDELSAAKNKFDIDIQPAKDKVTELQSLIAKTGSGTVKVLNQDIAKQIEEGASNGFSKVDAGKLNAGIEVLYNKYKGVISHGTLRQAATNVIQRGLTDVGQAGNERGEGSGGIIGLVDRYVNAAAQGRNKAVALDTAIVNLAQAFKTGQSELGDASGISENFGILQQKALDIYNEQHKASVTKFEDLTKEQQAQSLAEAQLQITTDRANGYTSALNNGLLTQAIFDSETRRLSQTLGDTLTPEFNKALEEGTKFISALNEFVKNNPDFVKGIVNTALAITGLATAITTANFAWTTLGVVMGPVMTVLGAIATAIGWPVAALVALVAALALAVTWVVINWDRIKRQFELGGQAIKAIFSGDTASLTKIWEEMFKNINDATGGFFKGILNFFVDRLNDVINIFNNFRNSGFGDVDIPGFGKFKDRFSAIGNIQKLAGGGQVQGRNAMTLLNDGVGKMAGREQVVSGPTNGLFGGLISQLNDIGNSSVSTVSGSYNNTTTIYNQNFGSSNSNQFTNPVFA